MENDTNGKWETLYYKEKYIWLAGETIVVRFATNVNTK